MIFTTRVFSPALWQTYLSDPASTTMEGILRFNKHLLFLLTVIVLFVVFSFLFLYLFNKRKNVTNNPQAGDKKPGLRPVRIPLPRPPLPLPTPTGGRSIEQYFQDLVTGPGLIDFADVVPDGRGNPQDGG